jgi:hypothetical protein
MLSSSSSSLLKASYLGPHYPPHLSLGLPIPLFLLALNRSVRLLLFQIS